MTSELTAADLRKYRIKLFRDAVSFIKPDRTPHFSFYITWPVWDSEYKMSEALYDWNIMEKVMVQHQQKYNFDAIQCLGTRNAMHITEAMGTQKYIVDDENYLLNIKDEQYLMHDELPLLAQDPYKAYWLKSFPRKYKYFKPGMSLDPFLNTWKAQKEMSEYVVRINKRMQEEFGVPVTTSTKTGYFAPGVDPMMSLMGIKGLSYSMRKDPELVKAAATALDAAALESTLKAIKASGYGPDENTCFDFLLLLMAQTLMSLKQFEYFMWNGLSEKVMNTLIENGKQVRLYFHGPVDRFYDYLKDYPKGSVILMVEANDVYEVKKNLPNVAICGGLTANMMGHSTQDECVDYTKRLIDELGSDGGLVLSLNTMGSYPCDSKPENLKAVSEFIQSYR